MKKMLKYVLLLPALAALIGCQQHPYPIFFLAEADGTTGNTTKSILMYNGKPYTRMPMVTHENLQSFKSFLCPDGSYGTTFTVKPELRNRLYAATINREGTLILPVVNSLAFEPVLVDRPITDGKLVVWGGLNGYDLKQIARDIKPENPEMEKKRFKDKNPRPLPKLKQDNKNEKRDHTGRVIGEIFSSGN